MANCGSLSISYRFAVGTIPKQAWLQDEDIGGGRIIGEACHAIDLCTAIANSPIIRVYAESVAPDPSLATTDDSAFITLRHQNGSISTISYQANNDRAGPAERIEVFGGGRTAILDDWRTLHLWAPAGPTRPHIPHDKGHTHALRAFITACQAAGPWPIPWPQLHNVTWATLAAVRSLRTGMPLNHEEDLQQSNKAHLRTA